MSSNSNTEDLIWQQLSAQRDGGDNKKKNQQTNELEKDLFAMYKSLLIPRNEILSASCQHECTADCPRQWQQSNHSVCTISGNDHLCTAQECLYRVHSSSQRHPTCLITGRICEDETAFVVVNWADRQGESECMQMEHKPSSSTASASATKREELASKHASEFNTLCWNAMEISRNGRYDKHINAIYAIINKLYAAFFTNNSNSSKPSNNGSIPHFQPFCGVILRLMMEGYEIRASPTTKIVLIRVSKFVRSRADSKFNRKHNFPPGVKMIKNVCASILRLGAPILLSLSQHIRQIEKTSQDYLLWEDIPEPNGQKQQQQQPIIKEEDNDITMSPL
jgi:hypothetical protein